MFSFRTGPLEDQLDRALLNGKVGCFCTPNSWDAGRDRYVYELFRERGNLQSVFEPEEDGRTPGTAHFAFEREQLAGLNAVVVEIQDAGSRHFNYTRDVFRLIGMLAEMGEAAPAMYVVDHLNPAGRTVEGTMPSGVTAPFLPRTAHRHGLTLGELCSLHCTEINARFPLHVISALAKEDNRRLLPWTIAPAADIPGMFTCMMYSGGGLWNHTTVTPGIGTARPYEYIGAPFLSPNRLERLPVPDGALLRPCTFTPLAGPYAGRRCFGYQILLLPGREYHSLLHTLQLMRHFRARYSQFELSSDFHRYLADPVAADYIEGNVSGQELREHVKVGEQKWVRKARRFLLYDSQPVRIK